MSSSCAITPTRGCSRLSEKFAWLFIPSHRFSYVRHCQHWPIAMLLGGVPDSRLSVPAVLEFAFRSPFVSYWRTRLGMSLRSLVFSKMLSFQQTGSAALS